MSLSPDRVVELPNQPPLRIMTAHVGIGMGNGDWRVAMGPSEAVLLAAALLEAAMENMEKNGYFDEPVEGLMKVVLRRLVEEREKAIKKPAPKLRVVK